MRHQLKALLVEDEGIVALDLKFQLEAFGFHVIGTASTGAQAIALASQERPDLALVDIRLRGVITGMETAEILESRFKTRIVCLSSFAMDALPRHAKRPKERNWVSKPIDPQKLRDAIRLTLKLRHPRHLRACTAPFDTDAQERVKVEIPEFHTS